MKRSHFTYGCASLWVAASLFSSSFAWAGQVLNWSELGDEERFSLRQDIILGEGLEFRKGQEFHLVTMQGLPEVPMLYAEAYAVDCPDMTAETVEMIVVQPEGNGSTDRRVAIGLKPGCHFGIYIEGRDYYSPSIFKAIGR